MADYKRGGNYRDRGRGFPNNRGRGNGRNPRGYGRGGYPPPYGRGGYADWNASGGGGGGLLRTPPPFDERAGNQYNHNPNPSNPYPNPSNPYPNPSNPYPNPSNPYSDPSNSYHNPPNHLSHGRDKGRYGPHDFNNRGGRGRGNHRGRGQGEARFEADRRNGDVYQGDYPHSESKDRRVHNERNAPPREQPQQSQKNPQEQGSMGGRGPSGDPRSQPHGSYQPGQQPQTASSGQSQPPVGNQFPGGPPPQPFINPSSTPPRPLRPLSINKGGAVIRNPGPPPGEQFRPPPPGFHGPPRASQPFFHQAGPRGPPHYPPPNAGRGSYGHPPHHAAPAQGFPPPISNPGRFNGPQFHPQPRFESQPRFEAQQPFVSQACFTSQPKPSVPFIAGFGATGVRGQRPYIPPFGAAQPHKDRGMSVPPSSESERMSYPAKCERSSSGEQPLPPQGPPGGYYQPMSSGGDTFGLDDIDD